MTATRVRLVRLRAGLLALTLVVLVVSMWAFHRVQNAAETVRDRTSQAVLEVTAARAALVAADAAAVASFASGEARLAGPGQEYSNQLALASQSLARVAEFNQAGAPGGNGLQVVESQVAAYSGSIGQADVHFRQLDAAVLGAADLWHASRLLHAPGGVLDELELLQDKQREALATQLSSTGVSLAMLPLWLLPILALLGLLVHTQLYLRKRFRRMANVPLLAATVLIAAIGVALVFTVVSRDRLDSVGERLDAVAEARNTQIQAADEAGQLRLADLLTEFCDREQGCGVTVDEFRAKARQATTVATDNTRVATAGAKAVAADASGAAETGGREYLIPAGTLLAGGLVLLGLHSRIDEYRYRP
ncbi:hypothetical protein [Amycolatopsis regifaucium]|uniref:Uncharacterized protein n=1 Tax=Amycolatopsis regifaucium TaxID=546365 RepID=A0A154MQR1_9PSEU|nr:hypothetical protein [Amycolatopsis regifaucium]KZB86652.1 hypothetical protein AVL48_25780 [Amycolatopsis regifaucium]OKA03717.1 hypothetical protein ATP06_0235190 [Amycolatopsis regifaucium]SFJ20239.1 hypothetical protein SAMN04489731_11721 [Amycolatopsis regifaucium]